MTVAERSKVVSLWHERAHRLGLSERWRPDFSALSRRALSDLAEQHRALYLHALPVMELLHQQILNTHSMVLLTDKRGLIMHALGDGDFLEKAEQVALKPGVLWSEDSKGTNAIGTALTEQRATLVHGSEHFLTVNRFLTCSCSPIRGPCGELIGALDVSGPQEGYHPHTMGLVRISTQMIENQLFIDEFAQALRIHFHPRTELLGTLLEGIAAFDEAGRMLAANANARALLGLAAEGLTGSSLESLFDTDLPSLLARRGAAGTLVRLTLRTGRAVLARIEPNALASCAARQPLRRTTQAAPERAATLVDLDTGDPAIAAVISKVRKVQGHAVPILILGETGTGKELLAHAIHNESERRGGPFIPVDCASLPESLIEAELFGYEEGAFTGARRRGNPGKILLADGGTLFLDEIGDMPLALQTRLLRVLQERAVLPLGAQRERPVDIVVICATHRDLKDMMRRGLFREDLYYRLNGLAVRLPALRERTDLETLVARIVRAQSASLPQFSPEVLAAFRRYHWPGNIRQLSNVLRTAGLMAGETGLVGLQQLPEDFLDELPGEDGSVPRGNGADLKSLRSSAVTAALERSGGNVSAAARSLGVSRNTIYRTMRPRRSA
ncbi:MAG: sigma-54-dependent Fis family transcriptional regulator [Pseudomonadota bacterium]|nr:sigma-54-dependent Fis family transcriptional regulator [Pseudomonadota bacterium]